MLSVKGPVSRRLFRGNQLDNYTNTVLVIFITMHYLDFLTRVQRINYEFNRYDYKNSIYYTY